VRTRVVVRKDECAADLPRGAPPLHHAFRVCVLPFFFLSFLSKRNAYFFFRQKKRTLHINRIVVKTMVAIASLSAGTLKFRKFPPSVELKNPNPSEFNPHIAVALGTSEGHLVPIMRVELPDGKILEPDAYRNLHMLEEFEIRNPSEYLHFEVLDVERTKEEKENLVVVAAVDGDNNSGGKRYEKGTTKKTPSTRKGHEENPKYVVIASTSIAVSHMLEDNWSHKLYGHCYKYVELDSPDGKEKNVCTMKLQMDYKVVPEE
jgi:hypothetical protein